MTTPKKKKEEKKGYQSPASGSISTPSKRKKETLYIVGIGASAGGLEALGQLFSNMPNEPGMAFVIVPHLDPSHVSLMPELLQKHTKMKNRKKIRN